MESSKIDTFMMTNAKFFPSSQIPRLNSRLAALEDSKYSSLLTIQFKDPSTVLIVSVVGGALGIDRFMIGDTGLGIGKLLTCGGIGIWTIVDWFMIQDRTREKNLEMLQPYLH